MRHRPFFLVAAALLGASAVHTQEPTGRVTCVNVTGLAPGDEITAPAGLPAATITGETLSQLSHQAHLTLVFKRPGEAAPYTVRLNRPVVPKAVPPAG